MRRLLWLVAVPILAGCPGPKTPDAPAPDSADAGTTCVDEQPDAGEIDLPDRLAPGRLLRRASLVLRGTPPTDEELATLFAAGDESAQLAWVDAFIDRTLHEPVFYRTMFELAHEWLNIPLVAPTADQPEYGVEQQRSIQQCPSGTAKAGMWKYFRSDDKACDGLAPDGTPAAEITLEPWWAPGTSVSLVGYAASSAATGTGRDANGNIGTISCDLRGPDGTCGCGPNAARCHPDFQKYAGWEEYLPYAAQGQRRMVQEEPARLFAHLAWHDRPLTDLVLGTYSVGPTKLQAAYVMQGLAGGRTELLNDDRWWRPSRFAGAPVDPEHAAGDPRAWREFQVPERNPFLLADRSYHFDPRNGTEPSAGLPAAGMLTSVGFLTAYPRERVRAARALETLACEVLSPPSGQTFNPYQRDPATEGTCQHCHSRVDPAAIHFKRWNKRGHAAEGWGAQYFMPGVGRDSPWHWPARWRTGAYPYGSDPFSHWNRWYVADTMLTPVSQAQLDANPEAVFLDFLPPEWSLLGQRSDGTNGPLGFAKLIVAAGAFDRCVVRHLHQQVLGRDVDPTTEAGYLDQLTERFVGAGRQVRPFVKHLTSSELFRRGL